MKAVSDWDNIEIGQFAEVIGGGTPSTKQIDHFGGDIPWLTPRDLVGFTNRYIFRGNTNLTPLGLKNSSARLMLKDTVIFSSRAPIGYVALAGCEIATNQGFRSLVCNQSKAFPEFVYYAMRFHTSRIENIAGGSTFKEISGGMLEKYKIFLPPLPTQKKIASILSTYDDLIENNNKRIKILEEMAQNIYREWFVHFCYPGHEDVPMVDSELGQISQGWEVKKLGDIVQRISDSTKAGEHLMGRIYIPIDCIPKKSLTVLDSEPSKNAQSSLYLVAKGDILFGAMRPYFHKVGIAPVDAITRSTCFVLRPTSQGLYSYAVMTLFQEETVAYASSRTKGATIPYAVWDDSLREMRIPLPPPEVLKQFETAVRSILYFCQGMPLRAKALRKTRDLLLPKLISGQLDVEELDIEV